MRELRSIAFEYRATTSTVLTEYNGRFHKRRHTNTTYCTQLQTLPITVGIVRQTNNKMPALRHAARPLILLFGDSITEQGFGMNGKVGWSSLLAADYSRRADVLNRGFFGYNSKHAVDLLPSLSLSSNSNPSGGNLLFCTVYFGANDATLPGSRQFISEDQFASNVAKVVTTIRSSRQSEAAAKTSTVMPIILMTPPPLDGEAWTNFKGMANRSNERHKLYGDLVKEVAQKHHCSLLDVWTLLQGDTSPEIHGKYLTDGLHLNELGNRKLCEGLTELIENEYPNLMPRLEGSEKGIPLEGKLWEELC